MSNIDKQQIRDDIAIRKSMPGFSVSPDHSLARLKAIQETQRSFGLEVVEALLDELEAETSYREGAFIACNRWHDKFRESEAKLEAAEKRIAELEEKLETADKLQDSAFRHGLQHGFSLGQTDNQAGFEECLSAYGTRGKDNG